MIIIIIITTWFVIVYALELVLGRRYTVLHSGSHSPHIVCSVRLSKIFINQIGLVIKRSHERWYFSFRYFKLAAATLVFCTVASWLTTGYIAYTNKHMPK